MRISTDGTRTGERGNIPMALIAIITIAGIVSALFAITVATQRSVRDDRSFQMAINGSDAGLNQALTQISELTGAVGSLSGSGTVGEVTYEWEATRNGNTWEIVSDGTANETTRTVEATVSRSATFLIGAFADLAFTMRGSNGADSYSSANGQSDTGEGSIGSNGAIQMNGNAFADVILLYGDDASCSGNGCSSGDIEGSTTRFDIEAIAADIQEEMDTACGTDGDGFETYDSSSDGPLVAGETYCFSRMDVRDDVTLADSDDGTEPSSENAVTIYLNGNFDSSNHVSLNCCGDSTPDAGSLQIYSTGSQFSIGNHNEIAAAIAAPNASCQGSPSNAQAEIYGSMLCNDLSNQGGWEFHYDQNLQNLGNGYWDIDNYREELQGESSFDD